MMISIIPQPKRISISDGLLRLDSKDLSEFVEKCVEKSLAQEEYRIEISSSGVKLFASDSNGFFLAEKTLEQISFDFGDVLPCLVIEDSPRFAYRCFMIDCARHFFSTDELKIMIDTASKFKFNIFHWHLSDDQGWRAEIPELPELCEKGSERKSSHFGKVYDPTPYGGFYTVDEMRDIVNFCHERFMTVIPEIEMPGHTTALISAFPELCCTKEQHDLKTTGGIFDDILCAGSEKVYDTVFTILDSLCKIFTDEYFHIGGDEAPKIRWKSCPKCQNKIKELGLLGEEELQGAFINRIAGHLNSKGKKVITWNESLKGGNLGDDITVQYWMDKSGLSFDRANSGHDVIISDYFSYYVDYPYGMTPLKKTYNYEPVSDKISYSGASHIIGIDTPVWTEHIRDFDRMCYQCFPRYIAIAERAWSAKSCCDYGKFEERLVKLLPYLDKRIHYAPKKEWNPTPLGRLAKTASFFYNSMNKETVGNLIKPKEKK